LRKVDENYDKLDPLKELTLDEMDQLTQLKDEYNFMYYST
jgi:hypothetical protein